MTSFTLAPTTPAGSLVGLTLENGWFVDSLINPKPGATGSHFSVGYKVSHKDGRSAFLKAVDFSGALRSTDPTRALQKLTESFNFERDLLEKCGKKNFDRVVKAFEEGKVIVQGIPVPYLIFEMAEGDMRAHLDFANNVDLVWILRMLHHVTVGLKQLHSVNIAHQDLKPSNVLVFDGLISKLADLGRSAHPDYNPPHGDLVIPGGIAYAPPELIYGYTDPDFRIRRFGSDLYLLGNIVLFAFTRQTMSSVLLSFVDKSHMPLVWKDSYFAVLPFLQDAFEKALHHVSTYIPDEVQTEIVEMLRQLCEPDLASRGNPSIRNSYSLERFITRLNVLAYKAERKLF